MADRPKDDGGQPSSVRGKNDNHRSKVLSRKGRNSTTRLMEMDLDYGLSSSSDDDDLPQKDGRPVTHLVLSAGERYTTKEEEVIGKDVYFTTDYDPRWSDNMRKVLNFLTQHPNHLLAEGIRRVYKYQHLTKDHKDKTRYMPIGEELPPVDQRERPLVFTHANMKTHAIGSAFRRLRIHHLSGEQCLFMAQYEFLTMAPSLFVDEGIFIKDVIVTPDIDQASGAELRNGVRIFHLSPGQKARVEASMYDATPDNAWNMNFFRSTMVSLIRSGLPAAVRENVELNLRACDPSKEVSETTAWKGWEQRWPDGETMVPLTLTEYEIMRCFLLGREHAKVTSAVENFGLQCYRQSLIMFIGWQPIKLNGDGHGETIANGEVVLPGQAKSSFLMGSTPQNALEISSDDENTAPFPKKGRSIIKVGPAASVADLEAKVKKAEENLAAKTQELKTAIDERNLLQQTIDGERRRSSQYFRIKKSHVKTLSAGVAALVAWKYTPKLMHMGARWSAPRLQQLGRYLANVTNEPAYQLGNATTEVVHQLANVTNEPDYQLGNATTEVIHQLGNVTNEPAYQLGNATTEVVHQLANVTNEPEYQLDNATAELFDDLGDA
ncbi:hypothetical protein PFICI_09726 [Pestalotiopsis fici W106-1]|uniref:Uncharacterized protein n=1 Tax=Pestalotiopsis fici (strain W106-1 / CGMCC3.15140) TaxID=1229662 RepID=W3WV19_PESFW|nr:uncharacterized protein PFICI_09726 [Pestalotiopsis fici W106-1]ETS77664.1 hypothetical protein PFICI_09726 [Pestalotiopsis fici W106-1]